DLTCEGSRPPPVFCPPVQTPACALPRNPWTKSGQAEGLCEQRLIFMDAADSYGRFPRFSQKISVASRDFHGAKLIFMGLPDFGGRRMREMERFRKCCSRKLVKCMGVVKCTDDFPGLLKYLSQRKAETYDVRPEMKGPREMYKEKCTLL